MFNLSPPTNFLQKQDYSSTQQACQPKATPLEWNTLVNSYFLIAFQQEQFV